MQKHLRFYAKWATILSTVALCGCASEILNHDFSSYSEIYGDESNRQLLLNLARLANNDPVYFIQLGQISSQYQITTSVQLNSGNVRTTPTPQAASTLPSAPPMSANALTINGQANLGAVQTPTFQFFPLTGSNFVQAVLTPISDKVYLTFYDQGNSADLVARTMISQVEWEHIYTNYINTNYTVCVTNTVLIQTNTVYPYTNYLTSILNSVTNAFVIYSTNFLFDSFTVCSTNYYYETNYPVYSTNYEVLVNNPLSATYWKFLDFCDSLKIAQISHLLSVDSLSGGTKTTNIVYNSAKNERNPKLADVVAAIQAGLTVSGDVTGDVVVSQSQIAPHFVAKDTPDFTYLSGFTNSSDVAMRANPLFTSDNENNSMIINVFTNFSVATNFAYTFTSNNIVANVRIADAVNVANAINNKMITLKTRTFEAALYCAAKQEGYFQELAKTNNPTPNCIFYTDDGYGPCAVITNVVYECITTNQDAESVYFTSVPITNNVSEIITNTWTLPEKPTLMLTYDGYQSNPLPDSRYQGKNSQAASQNAMSDEKFEPPLCSPVYYNGRWYEITDIKGGGNPNRSVFTMLSYLFAQTTIGTQNLPVQQLIQVQ